MTKDDLIKQLKKDYPTLRQGNDEDGYQEIIGDEYDALIEFWADTQLKQEVENLKIETAKAAAEAKLAALGLTTDDLKALGLGGN